MQFAVYIDPLAGDVEMLKTFAAAFNDAVIASVVGERKNVGMTSGHCS
jgi:hypothetical protein